MAAYSIVILLNIFDRIVTFIDSTISKKSTTSPSFFVAFCQSKLKPFLITVMILIAMIGFSSRVHASYRNYGGKILFSITVLILYIIFSH